MFRIVFFGTSEFAVPSLKILARDKRFEIVGVVTQPDRPVGRHASMTPPPIKETAQELGITTILQPERMSDESFASWIRVHGTTCDAFVVISYRKLF
jgi:methionyl-tRNA formyltransferase